MYYSDDLIEEVRSRTDIVDLISSYVRLQKRGMNHIGLCPFHNEKTPSFTVSQGKQIFHCFGCGSGGNVFTFLMKYENMGFTESLKMLADRAGVALPEYDDKSRKYADLRTKLFEVNREAARFYYQELYSEKGKNALEYLRGRGLSDATIRSFGLGYSPKGIGTLYQLLKEKGYDDETLKISGLFSFKEEKGVGDRFWNRIMFPIIDQNNKVIGFGGRVMGEGKPKYLNSPETEVFFKKRNLFSLNFAKLSRDKRIIICEGYMDVISLYQAGFPNAIASMGTALTREQARLLSKYTDTVILMYDSDGAGTEAVNKAIPILREANLITKVASLKPYKDPDEFLLHLGKEELQRRIDSAISSFEFELYSGEEGVNLNDPAERFSVIQRMTERLIEIENPLERETYLAMLAERYNLSKEVLKESVNQLGKYREHREEYQAIEDRNQKKRDISGEEGILKSDRLLISWITENPELYHKIKHIISYSDFSSPIYQHIAKLLFEQIETLGEVRPAALISKYETEKEQQEAAALFGEKLEIDLGSEAFQIAFRETVIKVKKAGIERAMNEITESGDMMKLLEIVKEQKNISNIRIDF